MPHITYPITRKTSEALEVNFNPLYGSFYVLGFLPRSYVDFTRRSPPTKPRHAPEPPPLYEVALKQVTQEGAGIKSSLWLVAQASLLKPAQAKACG